MSALVGPALVAAALLALAGAQKLVDPTMTVGALRALRLPASPGLVRAGSAVELLLGVLAVTVGGGAVWCMVSLSYFAFAAFVAAALRNGTMIGSCGCFGREETPPHVIHLALNAVLAGVAAVLAGSSSEPVVDQLVEHPGPAIAVVAVSAVALYLLHAAYVVLPRSLAASRRLRASA